MASDQSPWGNTDIAGFLAWAKENCDSGPNWSITTTNGVTHRGRIDHLGDEFVVLRTLPDVCTLIMLQDISTLTFTLPAQE